MEYIFVTKRFIFKCKEAREKFECIKFGIDGQYYRPVDICKLSESYYIIDDNKKEIRSHSTLLNVTKKYITETYGEIEDIITRD